MPDVRASRPDLARVQLSAGGTHAEQARTWPDLPRSNVGPHNGPGSIGRSRRRCSSPPRTCRRVRPAAGAQPLSLHPPAPGTLWRPNSAELRGVVDEAGASPFWDGVAGRFFGMTFQEADAFNAIHGNQFIADLMPKHPIYTAMLPESAREIGRAHV